MFSGVIERYQAHEMRETRNEIMTKIKNMRSGVLQEFEFLLRLDHWIDRGRGRTDNDRRIKTDSTWWRGLHGIQGMVGGNREVKIWE